MRALASIVLFQWLAATFGIAHDLNPGTPLHTLNIEQWNTDDGLVSNNLNHVMQSSRGFLWIATYNGVIRFDGADFRLYSNKTHDAFVTDAVYHTTEDNEGNLWFATQGSGVLKFENDNFVRIEGLPQAIRKVQYDSARNIIWACTIDGLYSIRDNTAERYLGEKISGTINDVVILNDGSMWLASEFEGLLFVDQQGNIIRYSLTDGLLSNNVNALSLTDAGSLFVGTEQGLNIFKEGRLTVLDELKGTGINDIETDTHGGHWLATENGLARWVVELGNVDILNEASGLPTPQLTSLLFDEEGSLWLTSDKSGLLQLTSASVTTITMEEGLTTNSVNILLEHGDTYYIGLDNGDIFTLRGEEVKPFPISTPMNKIGIRDIVIEDDGTLWVASYNGLLKIEGKRETLITTANGLPDNRVRRLLKKGDELWVGTRGGIAVMKENRITRRYTTRDGIGSNYIMSLQKDEKGNVIAGTKDGGINIIGPDGLVKNDHPAAMSPVGWLVFNVDVDNEGHYWLSTNSGLYIYDGISFKQISEDDGLPTENIFDYVKDEEGHIWLTSHLGLIRIAGQDLLAFVLGNVDVLNYTIFDESDGMLNRECTASTPSILSERGDIYVPTMGGVAILDPSDIEPSDYQPPVLITNINADFEDVPLKDKIVLGPGMNQFVINYTSLSYLSPSKVRFQYRLEGFEDEWTETYERNVRYTNLPHGEYFFRVRGTNNAGIWSDNEAMVELAVLPYFYQTTGFYLVSVTLIVVALVLVYYWRITVVENRNRELRKLNAELDSFVYSTSHDLRAPLASIKGLISVARQESSASEKDKYMEMMFRSVNKLDGFIKDIINYSRNSRQDINRDEIDFEDLIQEVFSVLDHLDQAITIEKKVGVRQQGPFYSDRRRLFVILNNLISNAYHYRNKLIEDPVIKITVEASPQTATIRIADNGMGIPAELQQKIFHMFYRGSDKSTGSGLGLYIVKETLNKMKGKISVESEENQGTTFTIEIPCM